MQRATLWALVVVLGVIYLPARSAHGALFEVSGKSSEGVDVAFSAELTISGDTPAIVLANSSPGPSLNPADILGSFYFDIVNDDGGRPTLTYASAIGDVYLGDKDNPDVLWSENADLMALAPGDDTWQFQTMDASQDPFLGFGIGTVGNSGLSPNNFQGNIVDGMDYSIYAGDITTANMDNDLFVRDTATFTFDGLTGFTEADIVPRVVFGLGTAPDSYLVAVPLPAAALLGMLGLGAAGLKLRKCV